jgi:hypothetical protein
MAVTDHYLRDDPVPETVFSHDELMPDSIVSTFFDPPHPDEHPFAFEDDAAVSTPPHYHAEDFSSSDDDWEERSNDATRPPPEAQRNIWINTDRKLPYAFRPHQRHHFDRACRPGCPNL